MEKNAKWVFGKDGRKLEKGIFVIKFQVLVFNNT